VAMLLAPTKIQSSMLPKYYYPYFVPIFMSKQVT